MGIELFGYASEEEGWAVIVLEISVDICNVRREQHYDV
jgi:hypothetical protein